MTRRKLGMLLAVLVAVTAVATAAAFAASNNGGFQTSEPAMLTGVGGTQVKAIISVGDTLGSGYMFDAIPDGISISRINGKGTFDILVNHELSLVPFPVSPVVRQDPGNATVSRLRLNQHSAGVQNAEIVIPSSAGYQRFCSNFVVGLEHGFDRTLLFTNEEARDIVLRQEDSWHGPLPLPAGGVHLDELGSEQAGVVVAYDVKSGEYKSIYGMGRHNHENAVAVPGYGYPVVLSGDDTFDAPASQLFMYKAASRAAVWNDSGKLYAFVSNNPAINDYGDLSTASPSVTGHFIEVPTAIATGKMNGHEVTSADFDYPAPADTTTTPPPDNYPKPATPGMPDGPQWVLEHWSNENNVFQFIRVEDLAYDRTNSKVVYFADTGEPRAKPPSPAIPGWTRLARSGTGGGPYMNGRLFKLELHGSEPTGTATLSILPGANFDDLGAGNPNAPHQPDNIESTKNAIFFQEDPGSHNAQPALGTATNARIWRYDLATGISTPVAEVKQDVPGSPSANKGTWESSGIVDVSAIFGPGAFLVDIQAHGWEIPAGTSNDGFGMQRERGQLLLIKVANP